MASEIQLHFQELHVQGWVGRMENLGNSFLGYDSVVGELHYLACFITENQARRMLAATHPRHKGVVLHYLERYGALS